MNSRENKMCAHTGLAGQGTPNKETEEKGEEPPSEGPEEWQHIPIQDYIAKGFRPYLRVKGKHKYITLKRGKFEKSLGIFSEEKWAALLSMYPTQAEEAVPSRPLSEAEQGGQDTYISGIPDLPPPRSQRLGLMGIGVQPPPALSRTVVVDTTTLVYYEWLKSKGWDGDLSTFLNEVVREYFHLKGIELAIVIKEEA